MRPRWKQPSLSIRPWPNAPSSACPTRNGAKLACAFVVVGDGYDEAELRAFLGERLARYKQPRTIVVIDELPLTAIGKIDKKVLEAWEQAQ